VQEAARISDISRKAPALLVCLEDLREKNASRISCGMSVVLMRVDRQV
jgi:hypothetical protein